MTAVLRQLVLVAAVLTTGLVTGLYYVYACSVMRGLHEVDDRTFVALMQRFNRTILNGWFALGFVGAPLVTAVATWLHAGTAALPWLGGALALVLAAMAITFAVNVPLNTALAAADAASPAAATAARAGFEQRWRRWNVVRAVAAAAALCLLAVAAGA